MYPVHPDFIDKYYKGSKIRLFAVAVAWHEQQTIWFPIDCNGAGLGRDVLEKILSTWSVVDDRLDNSLPVAS